MSTQAGNRPFNLTEAGSAPELEKRVDGLTVDTAELQNRVNCHERHIAVNKVGIAALRDQHAALDHDLRTVRDQAVAAGQAAASAQQTANAHHERHAVGGADALSPEAIGAAAAAVRITAGTGLTGGGDLSADRSLSVKYGATAGTSCQGNDVRLSDARTPASHAATHAVGEADALSPAAIGALSQPTWAQYKFRRPQQCEVAVLTTLTALEAQRGSAVNTLYQVENGVFSFLEDCVVACSLTARVCPEEENGGGFQVYFLKNNDTTIMEQWYFAQGIQQIALSGIFHMDKGDTMSVVVFPHPGSTRLTWAGQPYGATQEDGWSFLHMQCSPQAAGI